MPRRVDRISVRICIPLLAALVHEVDAEDHMVRQRQKLQGEEKASLQAAGVADRHNQVGGLAEKKVPRDLLLLGVGQKRIASGKVSDLIEDAFVANCAPGQLYRLSGPVARVLAQGRSER